MVKRRRPNDPPVDSSLADRLGAREEAIVTGVDARLDPRKATILRAVVEQHVASGQPVGSQHLTASGSLNVSSATVRNDMSVLERDGYLTHPHTSAGRVPTDKGYRFFVDSLGPPAMLPEPTVARVADFFGQTHIELERLLGETSRLLSSLTDYAAVVVGPTHDAATILSAQLVSLGAHQRDGADRQVAILVLVLSNGAIEKHTLDLDDATTEQHLSAASAQLTVQLVGRVAAALRLPMGNATMSLTEAACSAALHAITPIDEHPDDVFVGGAARLTRAFDAVETIRSVLSVLERQYVVVGLMREALGRAGEKSSGPSIGTSIGVEHAFFDELLACSVVVAPYLVDGQPVGTVGVLGPTRMNYPQAMAVVSEVSVALGRRLSEN